MINGLQACVSSPFSSLLYSEAVLIPLHLYEFKCEEAPLFNSSVPGNQSMEYTKYIIHMQSINTWLECTLQGRVVAA